MGRKRFVLHAVAFAMAFLMGTSAWADISGTVYRVAGNCSNTGGCAGGVGDAGYMGGAIALGTFTAPQVNFSVTGGGFLSTFLSSAVYTSNNVVNGGADLTGSGSELSQTMSNCPGQNTSAYPCYSTEIVLSGFGTFVGGVTYNLRSDDGSVMTIAGVGTVVNSPHPQSPSDHPFSVGPTTTTASFTINYAATNGNPEDLILSPNIVTTPDGGTTFMLLGGALVGLETLRRKFRIS